MVSCGPRMAAAGLPTSAPLRAGRDRAADAEHHGDDRCRLRLRKLLAQARQMSAGDVAGFVREHADDLVRHLRVDQRAGVDEDAPAVHHEGVERAVVDDGDLDVLLGEAGGAQDRLGVVAQQLLDLGVADDRQSRRQALRARRRRRDGDGRRQRDRERRQQRERARGWRPPPHPDSASGVQSCPFGTASPMFSQPSGAPRQGQREPRSRVVARRVAPMRMPVRSGRMRQQRGESV